MTGEPNPYYKELTGKDNPMQLTIEFPESPSVDFVNEVEEFNSTFGKPNNYKPTIPNKKEWMFVYDFIMEELEEDSDIDDLYYQVEELLKKDKDYENIEELNN